MAKVKIIWDPKGLNIDSLGKKRFIRATDGDTPYISLSIRMLSIDTPEVHYPGNKKPSRHDRSLMQLAEWIEEGKAPINPSLGEYLLPKLSSGRAGTLQEEQGKKAGRVFRELLEEKLTLPSGRNRSLFVRTADEPFDQYGRLLAYIAPSYSREELELLSREERATFNLLMVRIGWAASFPIYPNLPKFDDLVLLQQVAKDAYESKRGAWSDPLTLTGYEFRMCVKLYDITKKLIQGKSSRVDKYSWIKRFCIDMTTRELFYPQDYHKVKPYNRIFVWPEDVAD
ncbi:MAG: nuclease, partial [Candidatus Nitrosothermus koennekii]